MANNEQISALVDNQLRDVTLLDELIQQPEAREQWQSYHLIGDVMRGETASVLDLDLTSRIADAIESEPAIVAPRTTSSEPVVANKPGRVIRIMRNAGQYAIAASVAVAAIFGVQQYQLQQTPDVPSMVLKTVPFTGSVAPVSLQSKPVVEELQIQELTEEQMLERRKRITAYLQDHALQQHTSN